MKGTVIIPRKTRDFEVAHRFEGGEHYIEVSVGSSANELYWDIPAKRFIAEPDRYEGVPEVLTSHGAGWLLAVIPKLASDADGFTSNDLARMANETQSVRTSRRIDVLVQREIGLPQGEAILLYEPPVAPAASSAEDYNNIVRVDKNDGILWRVNAPPPSNSSDAFVSIEAGDRLVAQRFFGDRFEIDIATGKTTYLGWSK